MKKSFLNLRVLGTIAMMLGLVFTYNLFAEPGSRIGGQFLQPLLLFGPLVLAVGAVLLIIPNLSGRSTQSVGATRLTNIGAVMLLIAISYTLVLDITNKAFGLGSQGEILSFLGLFVWILIGLPGFGIWLLGALRPPTNIESIMLIKMNRFVVVAFLILVIYTVFTWK